MLLLVGVLSTLCFWVAMLNLLQLKEFPDSTKVSAVCTGWQTACQAALTLKHSIVTYVC